MKRLILKQLIIALLIALTSVSLSQATANDDEPKRRQRHTTAQDDTNEKDTTRRVGATISTPKTSKTTIADGTATEEPAKSFEYYPKAFYRDWGSLSGQEAFLFHRLRWKHAQ